MSSPTMFEPTPPRGLFRPGVKAFQAGLRHAYVANIALETLGFLPNNNNMPPVASKLRKGKASKKVTYKKKPSPTSVVKKAILDMAQTYHRTIPDSTINSALLHNNLYSYNISAQAVQGTNLFSRQGDAIYMISCNLKGSIYTPVTAGAYKYRVMVHMSGEEFNPATLGTGPSASELFLLNTGTTFNIHGQVNRKAITILYDQVVDINSTITGVADVASIDIKIPLLRKFEYQADNSNYGKKQNLYVTVTSVVGGGTAGTTSTGQILMSADLLFKNL